MSPPVSPTRGFEGASRQNCVPLRRLGGDPTALVREARGVSDMKLLLWQERLFGPGHPLVALAAYFRKDRETARGDFKGCLKIMAGDRAVYFSAA